MGEGAEGITVSETTCIATSLVLDSAAEATAFPSAGRDSAASEFQLVYWRCVALCLLTARTHNPSTPLLLFCNRVVEDAAPGEIVDALRKANVQFVTLPLTYRLLQGSVSRWGNVFYVLDIVRYFVDCLPYDAIVLTDADCLWRKSVAVLEPALRAERCLLYSLRPEDQKNYGGDVLINGMSRRSMVAVLEGVFGKRIDIPPPHNGGEVFAATRAYCHKVLDQLDPLWRYACEHVSDADGIKTEEHLLNILAWANGVRSEGANPFIRRLWTNFEDRNVRASDVDLAIWHVPAEKKFGFRRMWESYAASGKPWSDRGPEAVNAEAGRWMGIPVRNARKLGQDLLAKVHEKATERLRALARIDGGVGSAARDP